MHHFWEPLVKCVHLITDTVLGNEVGSNGVGAYRNNAFLIGAVHTLLLSFVLVVQLTTSFFGRIVLIRPSEHLVLTLTFPRPHTLSPTKGQFGQARQLDNLALHYSMV